MLKVLFIGDVVGETGCKTVSSCIPKMQQVYGQFDLIIANAENSGVGNGVSKESANQLFQAGCDVLTGGNHSFRNFSIYPMLKSNNNILRPFNFSKSAPGKGIGFIETKKGTVVIINLIGQVYLDAVTSPFYDVQKLLLKLKPKIIIIDFHAEATGEKGALANFLDGKVSAVVGTHTHVQTNDARILKKGTGFITDVGMVGAYDSILGVKSELVIKRIITKLPVKFEVEREGILIFNAVYMEIDENTGQCTKIENVFEKI